MLFSRLYVDSDVVDYPLTKQICSKLKIPFEVIDDQPRFLNKIAKKNDTSEASRRLLYLTFNKGSFLKKCPGTSYYNCCDYSILHIGSFCFMDCSYCILQVYFHPPIMKFFVNIYELEFELDKLFSQNSISRVGTGEFTDSLIWEDLTGISELLIKKFSSQHKAVLELKTKTTNIENLEFLKHNKKTILSWSLNTPKIIKTEERFTATLDARLRAASRCESWGYPLAFHFDPMIIYEDCKKDYQRVVEMLFQSVSQENIVWISIGTLRFIPALKPVIQKRFPYSKIMYGEFITGMDGKMRYFKPLRMELYRHMVECIRSIAPDVCIYFCMEDNKIWNEVMGLDLEHNHSLGDMLDNQAVKKCGLWHCLKSV